LIKYHAFVDFDGTVTINDVGYEFFKHFTSRRVEKTVQNYRAGLISAVECLQYECDIYNEEPASADAVEEFIGRQRIRAGFKEFVKFCQSGEIKLTILSAGFDFYINRILKNNNLSDIELIATPTMIKNGRLYPDFIHFDSNVCPRCANCKGEQISKLCRDGNRSIFIGDGHSDWHGAQKAEIVFARSYLAEYMDSEQLDYIKYRDFYDILDEFKIRFFGDIG